MLQYENISICKLQPHSIIESTFAKKKKKQEYVAARITIESLFLYREMHNVYSHENTDQIFKIAFNKCNQNDR